MSNKKNLTSLVDMAAAGLIVIAFVVSAIFTALFAMGATLLVAHKQTPPANANDNQKDQSGH